MSNMLTAYLLGMLLNNRARLWKISLFYRNIPRVFVELNSTVRILAAELRPIVEDQRLLKQLGLI